MEARAADAMTFKQTTPLEARLQTECLRARAEVLPAGDQRECLMRKIRGIPAHTGRNGVQGRPEQPAACKALCPCSDCNRYIPAS
jgi:hypothetical protein